MGHPSEKVVKLLPTVNNKDYLDKGCKVCMRAKYPTDKFPLSDNKASRIKFIVICGARIDMFRRAELFIF